MGTLGVEVGNGGIFSVGVLRIPKKLLRDGLRFMAPGTEAATGSGLFSIVLALLRPFVVLFVLLADALRLLVFGVVEVVVCVELVGLDRFDLGYDGFLSGSVSLSEFGVLLLDFGIIGKGGKAQSWEINSGDGGPRTAGCDIFLAGGCGMGHCCLRLDEESLLGDTTCDPWPLLAGVSSPEYRS